MSPSKLSIFAILCVFSVLAAGCKNMEDDQISSSETTIICGAEQINFTSALTVNGQALDIQPITDPNLIDIPIEDRSEGIGCGDDVEARGNGAEYKPLYCCYIQNLRMYDPVNFPHDIAYDLGEAHGFEATGWFLHFRVYFNGNYLFQSTFPDPWVGDNCNSLTDDYGFSFSVFGMENQVGICCPAQFTVEVNRYYVVNYGTRWNLCCRKSISFPYRGPRLGPPCC